MRNFYRFLVPFVVFQIAFFEMQAQHSIETCGTATLHDNLLRSNAEYRQRIELHESLIQKALQNNNHAYRTNQTTGQILVIPLVVHIIHTGEAVGTGNNISDAQVNSAVTALNDLYRKKAGTYGAGSGVDMEIEFQLASRDPNCNPTTGIVRVNGSSLPNYAAYGVKYQSAVGADDAAIKSLSRWPNTDYYNIWVVSEIDNGGSIAGYAYYPGAPANIDGTIILNSAFGTVGTVMSSMNRGHALAHELGHAFYLYHTFEGDNGGTACPPVPNGCGSGQGDCIADTEPHTRTNFTCPANSTNTCTNTTYGSVYKNYMDYSSQTCSNEFTQDQKDRVRATITQLRPGLLNSQSLTTGSVSVPIAATCSPSGTAGSTNYGIGIRSVSIGSATVTSGGTVDENAILIDRSCNQQFSFEGFSGIPITINTGTANNENVKVYLDYNNNGNFTDSGELILTSSNDKTHTGIFTPPAGRTQNTALRLRVISDYAANNITGPCYLPEYGQIEEYAVSFISPLPVSFEMFTAKKEQQQVLLNWKTAQERNNHFFEIERSGNSKAWHTIGKVYGSGNTETSQAYAFTDLKPIHGENYYRLKQVDFDGHSEYSLIRTVSFSAEKVAFTLYPNPGNGVFTLKANNMLTDPVQLRVYDTNGRLIQFQQIPVQNAIGFSLKSQPAGLYMLEVITNKESSWLKLLKE